MRVRESAWERERQAHNEGKRERKRERERQKETERPKTNLFVCKDIHDITISRCYEWVYESCNEWVYERCNEWVYEREPVHTCTRETDTEKGREIKRRAER